MKHESQQRSIQFGRQFRRQFHRFSRAALIACSAWLIAIPCAVGADGTITIIRGATVIDGTGHPPRTNADVLISGGKVAAVGNALEAPSSAEIIDGTGKFVIPGLIDTHVHLNAPMVFELTPEEKEIVLNHVPKAFLYNGVTTILNAGSPLEWIMERRTAQREGRLVAPRIYATGESFKPNGGWGSRHGGGLETAADAGARVTEYAAAGVDGIKVIIDDGLGGHSTHVEMPEDMLQAIVAAANAQNLPMYTHAINLDEYHRAADMGSRAILHGLEDPIPDGDTIIEKLRSGNITAVPTLSLFEAFLRPDPHAGTGLNDPVLEGSVPAFLLANMRRSDFMAAENARFTKTAGMDPYGWVREALPIFRDNITKMHRAGVRIAVGTDAGGPVGYNFQGYNTPWEVKLLVECGLTPMEALVAATRNGAEVIGIADEVGTVETGKRADLLILSGNPMDDIENIRSIEWVIQNGEANRREAFAVDQ